MKSSTLQNAMHYVCAIGLGVIVMVVRTRELLLLLLARVVGVTVVVKNTEDIWGIMISAATTMILE